MSAHIDWTVWHHVEFHIIGTRVRVWIDTVEPTPDVSRDFFDRVVFDCAQVRLLGCDGQEIVQWPVPAATSATFGASIKLLPTPRARDLWVIST